MELNKYPIVGILKDGTQITDTKHILFNKYHVQLTQCISDLTKNNESTDVTIFVSEEKRMVYAQSTTGKTYSYLV